MSSGTSLYTEIYYSGETLDSLWRVEDAIEEDKESVKWIDNRLLSFALMTEPGRMLSQEEINGMSPMDYVLQQVTELLKERDEYTRHVYMLNLLKEKWEQCHETRTVKYGEVLRDEEVALCPPDELIDKSYLCGDYIKTNRDFDEENTVEQK